VTVCPEVRELFGQRRTEETAFTPAIDQDLARLWEEVSLIGLTDENRKGLSEKYPLMANCAFLTPPKVNEIVRHAISLPFIE